MSSYSISVVYLGEILSEVLVNMARYAMQTFVDSEGKMDVTRFVAAATK